MSENISFAYFRSVRGSKVGYCCAAVKRVSENESHVSFSFCSPKDVFVKPRARDIAVKRLSKHVFAVVDGGNVQQTALAALISANNTGLVPSWVRTALKSHELYLGLTQTGDIRLAHVVLDKETCQFKLSHIETVTKY